MVRFLHMIYRLAVLFVALALGSCLEKVQDEDPEKLVTLQVLLNSDKITRSVPTEAEKAINSVRIYAYRKDTGSQVGHYYRGRPSDEPIIIDLALPLRGEHEVEFYVIVNETSVKLHEDFVFAERMSREQIHQARFTSMDQSGSLPLYCKNDAVINVENTYDDLSSEPGHEGHDRLVQKLEFSLLPAVSKISIFAAMAEGVSTTTIHYLGLLKGGLRQHVYFLPKDDQALAEVPGRAVGRDLLTTATILTKHTDGLNQDSDHYDGLVFDNYISETEVGSEYLDVKADDRQVTVHVQYSVGEGGELRNGYIYMPKINRNTHYKVYLLITSEGRIILSYTVAPWDKANMTDVWFDYPTHSYLEDDVDGDKPDAPATMSADKPFVGYFKMSYPSTETWRPTIIDANESKVTVKVYDGLLAVTPPVKADSDKWYRIEVTPKDGLAPGSEVELGVTYSPDFSIDGQYEFLMINGSQNNWYWPYEGASQQDANKVIITVVE